MRDAALLETARRRSGGRKTRSSRRAFFVNGASLVRGNGAVAQDWGFVLFFTTGRGAACPAFTADRAAFAAEGERAHGVEGWGMALGGGRCPRGGAGRRRGRRGMGKLRARTACGAMGLAGFVLL